MNATEFSEMYDLIKQTEDLSNFENITYYYHSRNNKDILQNLQAKYKNFFNAMFDLKDFILNSKEQFVKDRICAICGNQAYYTSYGRYLSTCDNPKCIEEKRLQEHREAQKRNCMPWIQSEACKQNAIKQLKSEKVQNYLYSKENRQRLIDIKNDPIYQKNFIAAMKSEAQLKHLAYYRDLINKTPEHIAQITKLGKERGAMMGSYWGPKTYKENFKEWLKSDALQQHIRRVQKLRTYTISDNSLPETLNGIKEYIRKRENFFKDWVPNIIHGHRYFTKEQVKYDFDYILTHLEEIYKENRFHSDIIQKR